jgi:hypothetical protein
MFAMFRTVLFLLVVYLPLPLIACGPEVQIVKKPEGLRKINRVGPNDLDLTAQDRLKWKSVLNWCDECDDRARPFTESFGGRHGGISVIPIGNKQYIVDVNCHMTTFQSEHIYYKVFEHTEIIESRLLMLDQYYFNFDEGADASGIEEPKNDPKGEFVRFTDSLTYGLTDISDKTAPLLIVEKRYRGAGGCGLYTVYDVSGDYPKVIEFRAKLFCSPESPMPEEWRLYPAEQRATWRVVPNPQREDWKLSATPACSK